MKIGRPCVVRSKGDLPKPPRNRTFFVTTVTHADDSQMKSLSDTSLKALAVTCTRPQRPA